MTYNKTSTQLSTFKNCLFRLEAIIPTIELQASRAIKKPKRTIRDRKKCNIWNLHTNLFGIFTSLFLHLIDQFSFIHEGIQGQNYYNIPCTNSLNFFVSQFILIFYKLFPHLQMLLRWTSYRVYHILCCCTNNFVFEKLQNRRR